MKRTISELPEKHQAAVLAFAAKYGRRWKSKLAEFWGNGRDTYEPNGAYLRDIRNSPNWNHRWLDNVKL